jgi:hypothetical protein
MRKRAPDNAATMQPIEKSPDGVVRFKGNPIVEYLQVFAKNRGAGLNELATMPFSTQDWEQFMQLLGYSVDGYCDLSMVSEASKDAAHEIAQKLVGR